MQRLTLAYRDDDRTPVIFAIREIATIEFPNAQGLNPLRSGICTG